MILLADWANFRKAAVPPLPEEEEASGQDDEGSLAEIVELLVENVQLASRHCQAVKISLGFQTKLDSLAAQVTERWQKDLSGILASVDGQLKALFSPLIGGHLNDRAVDDFCNALATAVRKDAATHLVISSPPELHDKLAARLAETGLDTSIVIHDGEEISTSLGATEITTEIGKWKADLQRLLS